MNQRRKILLIVLIIAITISTILFVFAKIINKPILSQQASVSTSSLQQITKKDDKTVKESDEMLLYKNCQLGYSISYPKEWSYIETINGDVQFYNLQLGGKHNDRILKIIFFNSTSTDQWLSDYSSKLDQMFPNFSKNIQINVTKIKGRNFSIIKNLIPGDDPTDALISSNGGVYLLETAQDNQSLSNILSTSFNFLPKEECSIKPQQIDNWKAYSNSIYGLSLKYPHDILKINPQSGTNGKKEFSVDLLPIDYKGGIEFPKYEIKVELGIKNPGFSYEIASNLMPKKIKFGKYNGEVYQDIYNGGWREEYWIDLGNQTLRISSLVNLEEIPTFYDKFKSILKSIEI